VRAFGPWPAVRGAAEEVFAAREAA
jgi:hypothetical protein